MQIQRIQLHSFTTQALKCSTYHHHRPSTLQHRPRLLHKLSIHIPCRSAHSMPKRQRSPPQDEREAKHARQEHQEDVLRHPSTKRAKEIDAHPPMAELDELLRQQKKDNPVRNVLHWFRSKDLRLEDNTALAAASAKAKEGSGSLITVYLWSPRDFDFHGTSAARSDFIVETLRLMQEKLKEKNIPLVFLTTANERAHRSSTILDFAKKHDVSHIYGNLEYEVDELRRDIRHAKLVLKEEGLTFHALHDQTVVQPGRMTTGTGGPHRVFTPFHKSWLALLAKEPSLLNTSKPPASNDESAKDKLEDLFDSELPKLPEHKQFASEDERKRIRDMWPAGHDAGMERLETFLKTKVKNYADDRSIPAKDPSSRLSAYFSAGVISVREALSVAKQHNKGKNFDSSGDPGIAGWVREIVFREFYRQVLVILPHNSMNLPHNLKFHFVKYEDDYEAEKKWYEGKTGVPFIDAGMRQLNTEAYMHNRLRMNVASYLRANLLIDYRKGERYFAEHLIDWDMGNNTQGWEPGFTIFNPVIQAEKCDPDGEYIRKWVPELSNVKGKAIFAPWERLSKAEFEKLGYPRPHVDFRESKERALQRYKQGMADANP